MLPFIPILYQDAHCVVVNKPAGMLVHRSFLDKYETVFLMQTLRDQIGQYVYPVHRLDKPVSGVMLFALSSESARFLVEQFETRQVQKQYWAIVRGWTDDAGCIDYPLVEQRDAIADKPARLYPSAQTAITYYQTLARCELPFASRACFPTSRYAWLDITPHTGRKHQIRRHLKHISHPIIGDTTHGDLRQNQAVRNFCGHHRLLLHARALTFRLPEKGEKVKIHAPVDADWQHVVAAFGWGDLIVQAAACK